MVLLLLLLLDLPTAGAAPAPAPVPASPSNTSRALSFNGVRARPEDLAALARLEAAWGQPVPDGAYWYDDTSGAAGVMGGPAIAFIGAGLGLGGVPVPSSASGGGTGALTGVFINGRELHPLDVAGLTAVLGTAPWPGRWWVDGQGNYGLPGQAPMGNLVALAAQKRPAGGAYYRADGSRGESTYVGSGCAAVSGRLSPSNADSSYSYYVGCE